MEIFFKPLANLLSEKESKIVQHIIKLREDEILSFNQYLIDEIYNKYKIDGSVKINALINSDVEMVQEHNRASVLTGYYEYAVVKYTFGIELDETSLHYERFMNHLKFFFQRLAKNVQVIGEDDFIFNEVKNKYSKAYECAKRIEKYLMENFKRELTNEEKAYLTIHIQRITQN